MPKIASRKPTSYGLRHCEASRLAHAVSETTASSETNLITPRTASPLRYSSALLPRAAAVDAGGACEVAVDARHALHFALGREALVEAFFAELLGHLRPWREAAFPARDPPGF